MLTENIKFLGDCGAGVDLNIWELYGDELYVHSKASMFLKIIFESYLGGELFIKKGLLLLENWRILPLVKKFFCSES